MPALEEVQNSDCIGEGAEESHAVQAVFAAEVGGVMAIDPETKKILDNRLASGEIGKEEYRELLGELKEADESIFGKSSGAVEQQSQTADTASKSAEPITEKTPLLSSKHKKFLQNPSSIFWVFGSLMAVAFFFSFMWDKRESETPSSETQQEVRSLTDEEIESVAKSIFVPMRSAFRAWHNADELDREHYGIKLVEAISKGTEGYRAEDSSKISERVWALYREDNF